MKKNPSSCAWRAGSPQNCRTIYRGGYANVQYCFDLLNCIARESRTVLVEGCEWLDGTCAYGIIIYIERVLKMMNRVRAVGTTTLRTAAAAAVADKNPRNFDTLRPKPGRRSDVGSTGGT